MHHLPAKRVQNGARMAQGAHAAPPPRIFSHSLTFNDICTCCACLGLEMGPASVRKCSLAMFGGVQWWGQSSAFRNSNTNMLVQLVAASLGFVTEICMLGTNPQILGVHNADFLSLRCLVHWQNLFVLTVGQIGFMLAAIHVFGSRHFLPLRHAQF